MVIRGMADKQIARELGISAKTVEKHVGSILRKTGARNRTMLAGMNGSGAAAAGNVPHTPTAGITFR